MSSLYSTTKKERPSPKRRPSNPLAEEVIAEIRQYAGEGYETQAIQLEFAFRGMDISYITIYNIVKGKTYRKLYDQP